MNVGSGAEYVAVWVTFGDFIRQSEGEPFIQTGGINTVVHELSLGRNSSKAIGRYELSGTGQLSAYSEEIGPYGSGTFIQSGGTNTAGAMALGSMGNGTYQLSGTGQLTAGTMYVGLSGTGAFSIADPTAQVRITSYLSFGTAVTNRRFFSPRLGAGRDAFTGLA